ncbi:MAG: bifunctional DNA-binding transcriptional regulator/O6-methylguanine-DNA methyltransferase Ada, partial [Ideonella sp.]|nr:bifunctional DNA-binding transcriptional regulator/O6-methylguanine-DNA methyltransferase Ada [Ideonella sp.]
MNPSTRASTLAAGTGADARWAAVRARDARADGTFVYSVRTTGVYCRPGCGARPARPENVAFHDTPADAERAGFRPCRRCRPHEASLAAQQGAIVARLCRRLDSEETPPSLAQLAEDAQWSPFHLHRVFKRITGLTPKAYAAAQRSRRMQEALARSGSVTEAIHDAGYPSGGRFYAEAPQLLGMTPTRWRAGGADAELRFAVGQCSLGAILVARSEVGLCAIALGDDPEGLVQALQDRFPRARLVGGDAAFEQWVARVVGFVEAPAIGLDLPLDIRGTAFQRRVWQALQAVPPGETVSYAEIARRIGAPAATRAVAQACGANALAVAIPCHRVVRRDGAVSGYRWGVERKRALLAREARP